ncbi:MAG: Rrf2 family transcriptional regulator [Proteobacteria bacterium]|nr:Rrf2 family transcriptional regulator [Pseudomonadota bacterium]
MKLSTKGRYAVMAMLDLALNFKDQKPVKLIDISKRQGISLSYLEQLFTKLRRHGLVNSTRGPNGGYNLSRETSLITIAEIITAVDECIDATRCKGKKNCRDTQACITHELWTDLSNHICNFLNGITLDQILESKL